MLTDAQRQMRDRARQFAVQKLAPIAAEVDRTEILGEETLTQLRTAGFLNGAMPVEQGGQGMDPLTYGLVTEEIGRTCSSLRSLMTVHNMVVQSVMRFGTPAQKSAWLSELVVGDKIAAFALSEPESGSVAEGITCTADRTDDGFRLNGIKSWISLAQRADVFLLFAKVGDQPAAFLLPRTAPGLSFHPRHNMLGTRGAMLADLHLQDAIVPEANLIGELGAGLRFVASTALDHGRFSVAWGTLGTLRACLEDSLDYAEQRKIGGTTQRDLPLAQQALADMWLGYETSRGLCVKAAQLRAQNHPDASVATSAAKFHTARSALSAATDAVRLHGANGCSPDFSVNRYLRDACVAEIIEGTPEAHTLSLARHAFRRSFLD